MYIKEPLCPTSPKTKTKTKADDRRSSTKPNDAKSSPCWPTAAVAAWPQRAAGCSHTTIARTAQRDPDFAAELDAAEHNAEIEALRQIRKAAKTDRYWRAAAWLLERTNPRDFARLTPATLTEEDACNLAMRMVEPVVHNMTDEGIRQVPGETIRSVGT